MDDPVKRILSRLKGVKKVETDRWKALCPAHKDRAPSLSVARGKGGTVLLKCFAGCTVEEVCDAVGIRTADLFPRKGGGRASPAGTATPQRSEDPGVTLKQYARRKRLRDDFLDSLGITTVHLSKNPAVSIPYLDEAGNATAVRFRLSLAGDSRAERFRWRNGSKLCLYGLNQLKEIRAAGHVTLVEGESDCHTLWWHGLPALGLPGASSWKEERDAQHLEGLDPIYVVIEPDKGGEEMLRWIGQSAIRSRVKLVRLPGFKDPSEMYLASPRHFLSRWRRATRAAVPWDRQEAEGREDRRNRAFEACNSIADADNILELFHQELQRVGVVGEERAACLLYLALTSRLLEHPVSVAVKSPSSTGKSFVTSQTLRFFPDPAYYALTAMSERALAYSTVPLRHRFLIVYEATGISSEFASYLIRSLLSEGRLRYETVVKTIMGMEAKIIEREGPTGLITTTTLARLHPENETRMLSVAVDDSPRQTRRVLRTIARPDLSDVDFSTWHAFQEWIENGDCGVRVPFAPALANLVPTAALRMRRDFRTLLSLIGSHAILHQRHRRRSRRNEIIATLDDYAAVHRLTHDLFASGTKASVPKSVRQTVKNVKSLSGTYATGVPLQALARRLGIAKSNASRRVNQAIRRGFLVNKETRQGRPARLVVAEPLPDEIPVLPAVAKLREGVAVLRQKRKNTKRPPAPRRPGRNA